MKYLKMFNESNLDISEILEDCSEILLDIKDLGFRVEVYNWSGVEVFITNPTPITISGDLIGDDLIKELDFQKDVRPYLEHLISFLDEKNYKLQSIFEVNSLNPSEVNSLDSLVNPHRLELRFYKEYQL